MRKLLYFLLLLIFVTMGYYLFKSKEGSVLSKLPEEIQDVADQSVMISVLEDTLSPCGASFQISNYTNEDISYGPDEYYIEFQDGEIWRKLKMKQDVLVHLNERSISASQNYIENIAWESRYGELSYGHYRISYDFTYGYDSSQTQEHSWSCEFDILKGSLN